MEPWYRRWFGEAYQALYRHRDQGQAECQTEALLRVASAHSDWRILDVGCGAGRHLRALNKLGFQRSCGVDLSAVLLREARRAGPVARSDMRRLPFREGSFDLLGCFFSSFGYFATFAEDMAALREFRRVVKPGGLIFLDLSNPEHVRRHLVSKDRQRVDQSWVEQERFLEGDQVVKRIRIQLPDGSVESHEERLRLFALPDLQPHLAEMGLAPEGAWGDERGHPYDPVRSPRLSLVLRRA